jgi:hypothetical protein
MQSFKSWFAEATVKGSLAGEAMKKTLEFKVEAEWIKWSVEKKGWMADSGTKDSFDLAASFYNPKVPRPAFFFLRSHAILEKPDAEYDSMKGGQEMTRKASMFLFNGKTGLGGVLGAEPKSMKDALERHGHIKLSERLDSGPHASYWPGFLGELDGPALRTPMQLAEWVNKVIDRTEIDGGDDGDDDPRRPIVPSYDDKFAGVR